MTSNVEKNTEVDVCHSIIDISEEDENVSSGEVAVSDSDFVEPKNQRVLKRRGRKKKSEKYTPPKKKAHKEKAAVPPVDSITPLTDEEASLLRIADGSRAGAFRESFMKLREFVLKNQSVRIAACPDPTLNIWFRNIKYKLKTSPQGPTERARIRLLEGLLGRHILEYSNETAWNSKYEKYLEFTKSIKDGRKKVSKAIDPSLIAWVRNQKSLYKRGQMRSHRAWMWALVND